MILLTGSHGFVGSHLRHALRGHGIVCVDPRMLASPSIEVALRSNYEAVVHMGAISDTTCRDIRALQENNEELSVRLFDFCTEKKIPFVYASSFSVYGNGTHPLNHYAAIKLSFDNYAQYAIEEPPHWYGLRFTNVYGPGEDHKGKQASMVSQAIEQVDQDGFVTLFNVEASRDFVHVSDCVSVARWLLQTLPSSGIYDVGTGVSRPFDDIAQCLEAGIAYVPMPKHLEGKYQFHTQADLSKLRAAGYARPFLSLEEGIGLMRVKEAA